MKSFVSEFSMALSLFYSSWACSMVPYIALAEAGAVFDVHVINMAKAEHMSMEYKQVSPKLLPSDPDKDLQALSFLAWCASGIQSTITPHALPSLFCDLPYSADSVKRVALNRLRENYQIAEFSSTDIYFFCCFLRSNQFGYDLSEFKNCQAHMQRMQGRASVQKLNVFETKILAEL
jgi:glutathione S-transferase